MGKRITVTPKTVLLVNGAHCKTHTTATNNIAWQMAANIRSAYQRRHGRHIASERYYALEHRIKRRIKDRVKYEFERLNKWFK